MPLPTNNLNIYHHNNKGRTKYRYSLGSDQGKVLYVLGLNPSKACPEKLDPTVGNVQSFARLLGFDTFVMLNLYSQRSTDPNGLHKRLQSEHHQKNLEVINELVEDGATVWAAWGDLIEKRSYLRESLQDICNILETKGVTWIQYESGTKKGHPKHPARKKHEDRFCDFDIDDYLRALQTQ